VEEKIEPVTEMPVERSVKLVAQTAPSQFSGLESMTTSRLQSVSTTSTTSVTATTAMHGPLTPAVVPVEPMPAAIPGLPSPFHTVDFCVPVGPDFSLVTGL